MNGLLSLLSKDSIKVAHLERIYSAYGASEGFGANAISAMRQLDADVAWRAVWLLKRLAVDHRLGDTDLIRLTQCAEEMTDWASRLNLCQLLATTGCPASTREALYPYLVECFANRRPMIRAWAISVLVEFQSDERYRKSVRAMLREAHADSAGSIQARLRRLGLKMPKAPEPTRPGRGSSLISGKEPRNHGKH
jgi:hypothetical protein